MPRSTIRQELKTSPFIDVLGGIGKGLTAKQRRFAEEIANGETGAGAYRRAYSAKGKPKTIANDAYKLKNRPDISATVEAINRANQIMQYQTSEGLRSLAVSSLVEVLTNPNTSPAVKVSCARIIGTMTEVSLFTHRTESKVIHSSEDIKAKILKEISALMNNSAEDVIARDAVSLLTELTSQADEPHPAPTPTSEQTESPASQHTILPEQSENSVEMSPPPHIEDDPLNIKKA